MSSIENNVFDPTAYFSNRIESINKMKESNVDPYPHKFHVDVSIPEFIKNFSNINDGVRDESQLVSIAGRIMLKTWSR